MAYNKIFFNGGANAYANGLGAMIQMCDQAGIPVFIASTDGTMGLMDLQTARQNSGVGHQGSYRSTGYVDSNGNRVSSSTPGAIHLDVPDYTLPADQAAAVHWHYHKKLIPPELDKNIHWISTANECRHTVGWGSDVPDPAWEKQYTGWVDWLAHYSLTVALLAMDDGYKYAAFGWASGNPDTGAWEQPWMLSYLRLCEQYPDKAAVALHEYSYRVDDIFYKFFDHIGRFEYLLETCNEHGIAHPKIFITEWGWTLNDAPGVEAAMADIGDIADYYAEFPAVQGAAIWTLLRHDAWGGLAYKIQQLIAPVGSLTVNNTFDDPPTPPDPEPEPEPEPDCHGLPRVPYARTYFVVPQDATLAEFLAICEAAYPNRRTVGFSHDDAGIGDLDDKTAVLYGITTELHQIYLDWYDAWYPGTAVVFRDSPDGQPEPPEPVVELVHRPCATNVITQLFGANPSIYQQYGLPGHEGIDYGVSAGLPFYAAAAGVVVHASDRKWSDPAALSAYGWHVVLDHGDYCTVYAHAEPDLPVSVYDVVDAGFIVGYSGNTGNSTGYHLHFGLLDKTGTIDPNNSYPTWTYGRPVNPWPFLDGLGAPPTPPPAPTGNAGIGLHASADPGDLYGGTAEFVEFKTLQPDVIKVLNAHSATSIERLAADQQSIGNTPAWIIRAFQAGWDRTVSPLDFFNWTIGDTQRAINALVPKYAGLDDVWVELHNEPNLVQEGWSTNWANGAAFGEWLAQVLALYRQALPGVRFIYPGLSPGGDVPGVRYDADRFIAESLAAAKACDAVGMHRYWIDEADFIYALAGVDGYEQLFPGQPLWITEASRIRSSPEAAAPTAAIMADDYAWFHMELRHRPQVLGVTYFVASASNPLFAAEAWVVNGQSRGIAAMIRS